MRKNKLMAKLTALTLVVALGTGSFFSGTTKTALADVMESVTQTTTELQTTTEAPSETVNVSTETVTAGEKQDNDKSEKSEDSVKEDEKTVNTENKDTVVKDEETVDEITPTKYSSGTVSIHRTKSGEPLVHAAFEIYGLKDNGKAPESLEQFEGMKFYSHGLKYTDDNGDLTFTDLELDEDEWYFIKDLSNNKVVNVGSLPFFFDSKPTDGRIENNNGKYILYDIHFNVTDKKATITNFPKDEAETIMPLLFSVPEAKVQAGDSYNWSYKLYSSQSARSSVKIGSRVDFYYGSGNNRTQSSIFKLGDVYAACAQHNKSTTLKDTSVNESKYTDSNAGKLRKLLYYGYGGYDNGRTFIKAYGSKPDADLLAFATIISTSYYYAGQSCWDSWNVMEKLRKVVSDNEDPEDKATAATSISFKNSKGKKISTVNAHLAKNDSTYKDENYYYSDWITVSSDGTKNISFGGVSGVAAYRKRGNSTTGATAIGNLPVKKGDKLKFRFDRSIVRSGTSVTVTMTSEGGISELYLVVGKAPKTKQDVMREVVKTAGNSSDSLKFKMPTDTTKVPVPPKYSALSRDGEGTQTVTAHKVDTDGKPLAGAIVSITNEDGVTKSTVTNEAGVGTVTFTYSCRSKTYSYFVSTGDLSEAEIENIMDTQHVFRTEADASREANAEVNELINQIHHYIATEISAPAGYEKVNDTRELELSGAASGDVTFTNAKSNVDTDVATYETYYYQELDIGKVNSENTDYILPGVQFQAYPTDLGNGSTLIEIVYEDENGQMHSIKDENGIDTTLTDASDDYTFDKTNKEHRDFYGDWARKGASVVNTKTNANGVIRIGYVYKLRAVGNYSYVKDYNNLNSIQKAKADDLINNKGYYRDEASAYAAAKKEVTDQLENVNNKYKVWEYAEGIENPYDNKVYWDFARYILELGSDATISTLTRTRTITKYAEINKNDAQKVYAKHNDIVASDNEFFIED